MDTEPPICMRESCSALDGKAAQIRMFGRGDESLRAISIPDPMPAVGFAAALRDRTGGPVSTVSRPARLVAVPGRDGERPARGACSRARYASMPAGQELLALGSAHGNPSGRFLARAVPGPVACPVLPEGSEVPARVRATRRAARIRADGIGGTPLEVIWLLRRGPGSPGLF